MHRTWSISGSTQDRVCSMPLAGIWDREFLQTQKISEKAEISAHCARLLRTSCENKRHEANYLLSHHHLHRLSDKMKLPSFLRLPKSYRRKRSKARSDIGPIEGQSEPDPTVPRPTESTPDLRTGTSLLPMPSSSTPDDHGSNGM